MARPRPVAVAARARSMSLRPLLSHLDESSDAVALQRDGGRAFVSAALRPYLVAALADAPAEPRPVLVVAADDRQARDLATDLRAWLHPRPVRYYPSRGVTYESHLAPPPHLVGLRVAALDALLGAGESPVVVVSAVALSEKIPDPDLRPHGFTLEVHVPHWPRPRNPRPCRTSWRPSSPSGWPPQAAPSIWQADAGCPGSCRSGG